jgi:hypothetical protein
LTVLAVVAGACLETGKRKGFAHIQATAIFYVLESYEEALEAIANALKQWAGIERGDKGVVQVKQSEGTQTKAGLIGYIHKMPIAAKLWNVSEQELADAKEEYALVSTDPLAGKRQLNKSNFVKEIYAYAYRNFSSEMPSIEIAALQAIRSGEYAATSVWLAGASGAGLDLERANIYWRITNDARTCTIDDVRSIFFYNPFNKRKAPPPTRVPTFTELQRRADDRARRDTEHHYSRNHVVLECDHDDDEGLDLSAKPGPHHYNLPGSEVDDEVEDDVEVADGGETAPSPFLDTEAQASPFLDTEAQDE